MSTLVLLRHAKSSWDFDLPDHDRPLAERGRLDAVAAGQALAERAIVADLVCCSTATRTRQTWQRATTGGAAAAEVRYLSRIYHAWSDELLELVRGTPAGVETLMLIGHAPAIPDLAESLSGEFLGKYPTSGLAILDTEAPWAALRDAKLREFLIPRGSA